MKMNEWFLTIAQLFVPAICMIFGMVPEAIFYGAWIVFFGVGELVCKIITGKTLSGNVWQKKTGAKLTDKKNGTWVDRPRWQRAIVGGAMTIGMIALTIHFVFGHS